MSNTSSYHLPSRPASRFALKNKSSGDFLSHVDYTSPFATSASHNYIQEINEAQKNKYKIAGNGTEGAWYKHDDNISYRDPIKCRLPSADGKKIKEQHENSFSRIPTSINAHQIFMRTGVMREQVTNNCSKIRGNHEIPQWFVHQENLPFNDRKNDNDDEVDMMLLKTRLTSDDALYYRDRNKLGNNIFGDDSDDDEDGEIKIAESNWRPETRTGMHPRAESDLWFHHEFDPQQNCLQTSKHYSSQTVRETVEKSQGKEMLKILQQVPGVGDPLKTLMIRKKSFQEQSSNSTMQYVLDQKSNKNFKNENGYPRAIKPEGMEIFKKNRDGSIAQCLVGYLDKAHKKEIHKISNMDEELLKKHKGVNMAKAIVGELPPTSRNIAPRVVKPEAERNAVKNQGSMKDIFTRTTNLNKSEQIMNGSRLRSKEAKEIARRYHYGSIKNLLF